MVASLGVHAGFNMMSLGLYDCKKKGSKVMLVGDVHEDFGKLNKLINKEQPHVIIACGDFGLWDMRVLETELRTQKTKIYFCDGNHENFELVKLLRKKVNNRRCPIEVVPNVYYMPRGTILSINGFKLLFMGGGESYDKHLRREGFDWFKEESITTEDINNLPVKRVDIVISHVAPDFLIDSLGIVGKKATVSETLLGYVFEEYVPDRWYFGHYHAEYRINMHDCQFIGLNQIGDSGYWVWLPESKEV